MNDALKQWLITIAFVLAIICVVLVSVDFKHRPPIGWDGEQPKHATSQVTTDEHRTR